MPQNRRLHIAGLVIGIFALSWSAHATDAAPLAPDFRLATRAGGELSLSSLRGQVVMINFWASWCGPCRQEFPVLDEMYRKYKPMGFALIGINVENEKADAERFLVARPVSFPILFDPDNRVSSSYGVSAMPTTVLIDRKGHIRWVHRAYKPGDEAEYIARILAVLREPS